MKLGTIEKSAHLSAAKVVLGQDATPVDVAPISLHEQNSSEPAAHAVRPALSAREYSAALEMELAAHAKQIAELQQQLTDSQASDAAQRAALAELQDTLAAAQLAAEQRGYAEGSAAAEQAVQAEWQQQLAAWEQGLAELAAQHSEYRAQLQAAVADIAMAATVKVIGAQLTDAQQIASAVEHIVYESGLAGAMKVFLAPTHYEELMRAGGATLQRLSSRQLELQPDPRVSYGGCLLETAGAVVDGRYEVQLKKLQAIVSAFRPAADAAS